MSYLKQEIESANLDLDASRPGRFRFHLKIDGKDVPCASIRSVGHNEIQIRRLYNAPIYPSKGRLLDDIDVNDLVEVIEFTKPDLSEHVSEKYRLVAAFNLPDERQRDDRYRFEVVRLILDQTNVVDLISRVE